MYKIKLTARARSELKNLSKFHIQAISEILEDLKDDPTLGKPLARELTSWFSYRVSVFRIIYRVNEKDREILIITAGHRSTVYN